MLENIFRMRLDDGVCEIFYGKRVLKKTFSVRDFFFYKKRFL